MPELHRLNANEIVFCFLVAGPLLYVTISLAWDALKRRRRYRGHLRQAVTFEAVREPHSHVKIHAPRADGSDR